MPEGLKWFTCSYDVAGRSFVFHIEARNWDEASAHLRAIGTRGVVDGELVLHGDLFPTLYLKRLTQKVARTLLSRKWM